MRYVVLLRGINVGGNQKVEMKRLKAVAEGLGYENVSTYINSGNLLFDTKEGREAVSSALQRAMKKEFGSAVPTLVKTLREMQMIAKAIPPDWQNDTKHKTDVIYLFAEADKKGVAKGLPVKLEYIDARQVKGALIWRIERALYNKSQASKIAGSPLYRAMTVRNVNTARRLGAG